MIRAYESTQTLWGQAPDDLHPTLKKVQAFLRLQPGWHYGRGMAFTPELIREALQFHVYTTSLGFYETDAFPGLDGSIMLTVYEGPDYIEFTLNPCGGMDYRRETDDVEVSGDFQTKFLRSFIDTQSNRETDGENKFRQIARAVQFHKPFVAFLFAESSKDDFFRVERKTMFFYSIFETL